MKCYSEKLPRKLKNSTIKCQSMNSDGFKCNKKAIAEIGYHGDSECYINPDSTWLAVFVCKDHIPYTYRRISDV